DARRTAARRAARRASRRSCRCGQTFARPFSSERSGTVMRMTWILSLVFVGGLLVAAPQAARGGDLTVRDVIELHRAGLGDEVLIALIEVDGGPFALSQPDVLDLRAEGLSDAVIAALVRAGRSRRSGANMWASQDDADTPPV